MNDPRLLEEAQRLRVFFIDLLVHEFENIICLLKVENSPIDIF
jgi:hypothetical protein